jgi:hypothetical protein
MCVKNNLRRLYLLTHVPTERRRPFALGIVKAAPHYDTLFEAYKAEAEQHVKDYGGGGPIHLSKRDIERWGYNPPVGARVCVVEFEVPRILF